MLVLEIHHVSLNVSDTARSLDFYCGGLGMAQLERPDFSFGGAWLDAGGGTQIHLIEAEVPPDHGQHVAFRVADLGSVIELLEAKGIKVSAAKPVGDTPILQAFARDPDGNLLEFSQPPD